MPSGRGRTRAPLAGEGPLGRPRRPPARQGRGAPRREPRPGGRAAAAGGQGPLLRREVAGGAEVQMRGEREWEEREWKR